MKEVYLSVASTLSNYKEIGQIELAEKYLEGGPNKDAYLAALVLRYWNIIDKMVYKDYGLYDEKEAYDWFMDSLLYALQDRPWRKEGSTVYNDSKAIERILNTCVKCARANWFQASNRHKRKINHNLASLESLSEDYNDAYVPRELVMDYEPDSSYKYIVIDAFEKQQYLFALIVDIIVNDLELEKCKDLKSLITNLKKSIKTLDKDYPQIFATSYNIPREKVENSFQYIYNMSDGKLKQAIENYVYKLKVLLKNEVM